MQECRKMKRIRKTNELKAENVGGIKMLVANKFAYFCFTWSLFMLILTVCEPIFPFAHPLFDLIHLSRLSSNICCPHSDAVTVHWD